MREPPDRSDSGVSAHARVSYVIARLDRAIRRQIADMVAPHGLTATQYTALSVLRMGKGLSNAQLARRSYVAPDHGRILRTELTAKGRRLLSRCDEALDRIETDMTRELSAEELQSFEYMLRSCVHMLHAGLTDA
jgi:DNA-binding MarR family transcriptional regulator